LLRSTTRTTHCRRSTGRLLGLVVRDGRWPLFRLDFEQQTPISRSHTQQQQVGHRDAMQTHIEMQMQMQMQCSHSLFLTLWLKPLKALRVFDQEAEKVATFTSSSAIAGYFVQT
jgi:hypothetical protein